MSYVDERVKVYRDKGIYAANRVPENIVNMIINMAESDYYNLLPEALESYLGLLAQQVMFVQQECNTAAAKEIELNNIFKIAALPHVLGSKIRSVEERWIFAASLSPELKMKFEAWQQAVIDAELLKDLSESIRDKLNVLKKVYDDKRIDGTNKHLHKYTYGGN